MCRAGWAALASLGARGFGLGDCKYGLQGGGKGAVPGKGQSEPPPPGKDCKGVFIVTS